MTRFCKYVVALFMQIFVLAEIGPKSRGRVAEAKRDQCYDADVIIVGAGVSGMACARELKRNGVKSFLILEGRNSTGGRFQSARLGDVTIELGPNWVHGTNNNPIYDLVKEIGITGKFEDPESVICRDEKGMDVTEEFLKQRRVLQSILSRKDGKTSSVSLREMLSRYVWRNETAIQNAAEYFSIDYMDAVPPELISGEFEGHPKSRIKSLTDPQFFITDQGGYKQLVDKLQADAIDTNTDKLKLNHAMQEIHWNNHGVRVITSDGKAFTSKVVILTVSTGVYQSTPNLFTPELPQWKLTALKLIKMATYTKIFLKFPYRFWDNVEYILYAGKKRGYFSVWQSLDAGSRFSSDTNILLITVTHTESFRIEKISKKEVKQEIMEVLRNVYGSNIPDPEEIVVPHWSDDKFFQGSYSYLPVNVSHKDFVAMRSNIGPLFFAGEAFHEVYQGYIHGAYFEGINRALDVIQYLKESWTTSSEKLGYDYYDNCLSDSCDCCYR